MASFRRILFVYRDYMNLTPDGVLTRKCYSENWFPFHAESYSEIQAKEYFKTHGPVILKTIETIIESDNFITENDSDSDNSETKYIDFKSGLLKIQELLMDNPLR